jgi:predicted RNA-binding Zn-ribbon protein involved in translation (DUF1610 family)
MLNFLKRTTKQEPERTQMIFVEGKYDPYIDAPCPKCGTSPIWVGNSCHTYQRGDGHWVSCMNCGSAGDLYCENEDCNWSYEWGLNPDNPRAASNEEQRPSWLIGKWPW